MFIPMGNYHWCSYAFQQKINTAEIFMKMETIITAITICSILWGGVIYIILLAIKKEKSKK